MTSFNDTLKELRRSNNISQKELAESIGATRDQISNWETGRGTPDPETIKRIAVYFRISADDLLGNKPDELSPDIRTIARAGLSDEEASQLRKVAEVMFPNAFNKNSK